MKGWLRSILAVVFAASVGASVASAEQGGPVFGASSDPIQTVTCTKAQSDAMACNSIGNFTTGNRILGFKALAGAAGSGCALYDATTVPTTGTTGLIDDIIEATQYDMDIHIWPMPYKLVTDLSVSATGGGSICVVYYQ